MASSDYEHAVYQRLMGQMLHETSRKARAAHVKDAARRLGRSVNTVYRNLERLGWSSGRKRRSDAGESLLADEHCQTVARIMARGRNKRGRCNVTVANAHRIAEEAGLVPPGLSTSTVARRLRELGLDRTRLVAQEPGIFQASSHPNHVWFFDISVAIQWYFRDDDGNKLDLYNDAGARFYEGKIENLQRRRKVIRRYLVTDHYSGAYYVRYYYGTGELAEDVADFLWHAMSEKSIGRTHYPLRGIPRRIVFDQGSANKSALVANLLEGLGVETEFHAPGNAKASGSVETRHRHWQENFEGKLSQRRAQNLIELNEWAEAEAAIACGELVHTRHGHPPSVMWNTIREDQLIEAPDRDVFYRLATGNLRNGVLTNRLVLRADGRKWHITGTSVFPGQRVAYKLSPFVDAGIRVWDGQGQELAATELQFDVAGFPVNGPVRRWDDDSAEGFRNKTSAAKRIVQAVDDGDTEDDRLTGVFDTSRQRAERLGFLATKGKQWSASTLSRESVEAEPLLSSVDAREEVARRLNRALGADGDWWRERIGAGVTESQLDALFEEFTQETTTTTTTGRNVG